jgi:hypothetical protein
MERLSTNPYALQRLRPNDEIPFQVSLTIVTKLTGQTTSQLLKAGRLFYVDHRNQSDLPRTSLYSAACDAMFYISPVNGDFLPLAIRTNFGKNLIYTPADLHEDWLLAKMMFNVNDLAMVTFDHLARSHFTVEALNLAALRTFSAEHPLMGLLKRRKSPFKFLPVHKLADLGSQCFTHHLVFALSATRRCSSPE